MADPMHQFEVHKIVDLPDIPTPWGAIDMSITNSTVAMMLSAGAIIALMAIITAKPAVVPGRLQSFGEMMFGVADNLVDSIIGHEGRKFFPFVLTLFLFILAMNFLGLFLVFTATSQLAITATFALMVFFLVLGVGFARNGLGFFKLFVPSGVPAPLVPAIFLIEVLSFMLRPVTLALRLFGNMLGGHVALKVFAGFIVSLGALGATGGVSSLAFLPAVLSLGGVVALTALEFLVAFLQAFVFAVLTCIYLNDVVNLGHGH
jgi:F-type H+-transporting ATPase subunit a